MAAQWRHQRMKSAGKVTTGSRRRPSTTLPRADVFTGNQYLAGTQIGAWDTNGGTAVNTSTARANVIAANVKMIRWQMWNSPCDLRGTLCQSTSQFEAGLTGIIGLGAEPLIGLPPIWNQQGATGTDPWSYEWQRWIIRTAAGRVRLYEMGNEPDNYLSMTGQQYYDTLWGPNVPALKAYARSLGHTISVGGPGWANSATADLTHIQTWLTACKTAYLANGNNRDYLPDFVSTHLYLTSTENSSQANALAKINAWGSFYASLRSWIDTNYAGLNDSNGNPIAPQIRLMCSEYNDTIDNNWPGNTQTWTDFYYNAMFNMFRTQDLWAAIQFTIASHSGTALDLLNSDGTAKPAYTSFKASILSSTAPPGLNKLASNTAEGGTSGTMVTAANSAAGGTTFGSVSVGTGTTFAFDSTRAHAGVMSFRIATTTTATYIYAAHSFGAVRQVWVRGYFYFTSNPAPHTLIRFVGGSGTLLRGAVATAAGGKLCTWNSSGGVTNTTTNSIALDQWIRIEATCLGSATAGQIVVKLFNTPESTTPTETLSTSASLNTGGTLTDIWWGDSGAPTGVGPYWMDDIAIDSVGYPGRA